MPLDKRKTVGQLISQLRKEGRPQKQSIAIAMNIKGKSKKGK